MSQSEEGVNKFRSAANNVIQEKKPRMAQVVEDKLTLNLLEQYKKDFEAIVERVALECLTTINNDVDSSSLTTEFAVQKFLKGDDHKRTIETFIDKPDGEGVFSVLATKSTIIGKLKKKNLVSISDEGIISVSPGPMSQQVTELLDFIKREEGSLREDITNASGIRKRVEAKANKEMLNYILPARGQEMEKIRSEHMRKLLVLESGFKVPGNISLKERGDISSEFIAEIKAEIRDSSADVSSEIDELVKKITELESPLDFIGTYKSGIKKGEGTPAHSNALKALQALKRFEINENNLDTQHKNLLKQRDEHLLRYKILLEENFTPDSLTKRASKAVNSMAFKRSFVKELCTKGITIDTSNRRDANNFNFSNFLKSNSSKIKEFQAQGGTAEDLANMLTSLSRKKIVSDKTWKKLADNLDEKVKSCAPIFDRTFEQLEAKKVKLSTKDKKLIQDELAQKIADLLKKDEKGSNVGHIQEMLVREIENVGKRSKLQNEAIINYIKSRMTEGNLKIYTSGFSAIAKESGKNMGLDEEKTAHGLFEECSKGLKFDEDAKKALMADFVSQYNPTEYFKDRALLGKRVLESSLIIHKALEKNKEALSKAQVEIKPQYKRIIHSKLLAKVMALPESFSVDDIEGFISQKISESFKQVKGDRKEIQNAPPLNINYLEKSITKDELESHLAIEYNPADHTPPPLEAISLKEANAKEFIEKATEDLDFENNPEIKEQIVEKFGSMLDVMRDNIPDNKLQALAEAFSDALFDQMDWSSTEVFKNGIDEKRIISFIEEKIPELQGKYKHFESQSLQDIPHPLEVLDDVKEFNVDELIAEGIVIDSLKKYKILDSRRITISQELAPMVVEMQNMIAEKQLIEGEKINDFLVEALDQAFESQISALNSGKPLDHKAIRKSIEGKISTLRKEKKSVQSQEMSFIPIGESDTDLEAAKEIIKNSLNEFSLELTEKEFGELYNKFAPKIVEMQDEITSKKLLYDTPVNEFLENIFANAIEDQDFGFGGVANYEDLNHQKIQESLESVISDLRKRKEKTQAQSSGRDSTDSGIDRGDGTPEPPESPEKRDILNEVKRSAGLGKPGMGEKISSIISKMKLGTQTKGKIPGADDKKNHRSPGREV